MKAYHQPAGLSSGLDCLISADWTPEQAWAVVEFTVYSKIRQTKPLCNAAYIVDFNFTVRYEMGMVTLIFFKF